MSKPCEPFGDHESVLFADLVLALDETRENIRLEPARNAVHRYRAALFEEMIEHVRTMNREGVREYDYDDCRDDVLTYLKLRLNLDKS